MTEKNKQVLLVNITRMGDLIQMIPLLRRLDHEWPGVEIDLVIDTEFAPVASLVPGLRHVMTYNFQQLIDESRARVRHVVALYRDMAAWIAPMSEMGYDRIVNLTFNRRSAYLVGYLGIQDTRGLTTAPDGSVIVNNAWMRYFADLHAYRRWNRFNLVDMYALGGSGPGPFAPIVLNVEAQVRDWAAEFLRRHGKPTRWIAVQVGASDVMKAWRPEYFGQTMAIMSRQSDLGFVLIGSNTEEPVVRAAIAAYRAAKGAGILCPAVGKTSISQLTGILSQCSLMVTNDTGPMHLAVGAGVPVVTLSVGHVDVWETGPYGNRHWVVQPDIPCGPCGFERICSHQACKDHVLPAQVAALCLHALGQGAFPAEWPKARVYESDVDQDGLGTFRLRVGSEPPLVAWYGRFWRSVWYETLNGRPGIEQGPAHLPPDYHDAQRLYRQLCPILDQLCEASERLRQVSYAEPISIAEVKDLQRRVNELAHEARTIGHASPAFSPLTTALTRDLHNVASPTLGGMADEQERAARYWRNYLHRVGRRLDLRTSSKRSDSYACTA